ncbi:glycosyltransferase family 2 protein [Halalkalibacterium halodurans]|uniref:glycosyltransferase family 2 protein n=1 Tax=Halalkalibacterium halodurans TaxID=86665 RepID=UPI002AA98931|nr:glycosyltransferase family 2 protein [Halalkalibacterium halodurans]MDY7223905.1 glycosyltransferase family 2 protein [Halalkalibacterium halodurans]MDY7243126.1 glycosyltransferase family 2 protein [Halalkalibacterium halodurans]MED4164648.1 glycosyltransferase family 2 protein [Halalkalibacterium halodurans]
MAKVTVILTSYNKPNTVGAAIESVLSQSFQDWDLWIMDDASNEETQQVIDSYMLYPNVYYYNSQVKDEERHKSTRYATLINEAISRSTGDYLCYLTDDNYYLPERLQKMVQYLDRYPSVDVVYSKQLVRTVDNQLITQAERIRPTKGTIRYAENIVDHCSVMHRRSLAEKVYETYGSYWNDDPICWHNGDAFFWNRLSAFALFYPINEVLDVCLKSPTSFQALNAFLPEYLPSGTLVKGLGADVYLIEDNHRRAITPTMFQQLHYREENVVHIPDPVLFKYKEGPAIDEHIWEQGKLFPNHRLIKASQEPHIYYVENHRKRHILTHKEFRLYKFRASEVVEVSRSFLDSIPTGPPISAHVNNQHPLPEGLLVRCGFKFYLSGNNRLYPIKSRVMKKLNLQMKNAVFLDSRAIGRYEQGETIEWKTNKCQPRFNTSS